MIRDFTVADQPAVHQIIQAGMAERWGDAYDPTFNSDTGDMHAYVREGGQVVVAETADGIVATGTLRVHPDGSGQLFRMATHPSHRRQGWARAIVEELVARGLKLDLDPIRVLTDTPWESAVQLYLSCGFAISGYDETDTHFEYAGIGAGA